MHGFLCRRSLCGLVLLLSLLQAAWVQAAGLEAAPLEAASIDAYVGSLTDVRPFGERLQAEGKGGFLAREVMPRAGQRFDPHRRAVEALRREQPDEFARLEQLLRPYGFTSPNSWARLGDRVVLAYGAVKADAESPEILLLARQAEGMNPQLLQLLPPEQRVELEQALLVARALAQVPAQDKARVRPFIARLDRAFAH
ncbi:hypothetical protein [Marinobacterium weihaiense]|uniref:Uncharacterized protein n=1 Tax=Marinobacterium weihaiense TaxID=2851016 RepID=A0ABS6M8R7_9GAMM|nr:hypothetical protein [Marinobacterium weihaiense]MBV0932580.1 hypothetical protein [Marinobacterium weihaiense]